jgi:hypothetical protein
VSLTSDPPPVLGAASPWASFALLVFFFLALWWAVAPYAHEERSVRRELRRFDRGQRKEVYRAVRGGRAVDDAALAAVAVVQAERMERFRSSRIFLHLFVVYAVYFVARQVLDFRPWEALRDALLLLAALVLSLWVGRRQLPKATASKVANLRLLTGSRRARGRMT